MDETNKRRFEIIIAVLASLWAAMTLGLEVTKFGTERKDRIFPTAFHA